MPKRSPNSAGKKRRDWVAADEFIVRKLYANTPTVELAELVDRTVAQVHGKAKMLGLKKSAKHLASPAACRLRRGDNVGAAYRFRKGNVPANKGRRRPGFTAGDMAKTQFKKGQRSRSWLPIGSERWSHDGYLRRKMTDTGYPPRDWVAVHLLIWQEHNGPVPAGYILAFRDGDKKHIAIDNLELITRRERMRRNTIHNLPESIKTTVLALGRLRRRINRESRHEKQD